MGPRHSRCPRRGGSRSRWLDHRSPSESCQSPERWSTIVEARKIRRDGQRSAQDRGSSGEDDVVDSNPSSVAGNKTEEEPAFNSSFIHRPSSVAIIGLGLMGGSLALALK